MKDENIGILIGFIIFALFSIFIIGEGVNANKQQIEICKNNPESVSKIYLHDDNKGITLTYCGEDNKKYDKSIEFEDTVKGQDFLKSIAEDLDDKEVNEILDLMDENKKED